MIVRIATEGQYRVVDGALDRIDDIDNQLTAAIAKNDGVEFRRLLGELAQVVRSQGSPVSADEIVESDLVLPPPDTSLEEAKRLYPIS